jgi:hypothetical protein
MFFGWARGVIAKRIAKADGDLLGKQFVLLLITKL